MKKARWISAAIGTAVLTAGFALPASAAFAQSGPNGDAGVLSLLSGNDVNAPVSVPVNVCGVAVPCSAGRTPAASAGPSATPSSPTRTVAATTATRAWPRSARVTT
jgi:hypothetical protein